MKSSQGKGLKSEPTNIIIRMPNWLGDAVMATPVLADLRKHWPNATLTAMCQSNIAPLLTNDPSLDVIYSFERPSKWIHRSQHLEIIENIKRGEYDLGVLLTNSFSSAWWLWRGKVHHRIGYATNLRGYLLNDPISFPKEINSQHLVVTYKMLLQPLGIPLSNTQPALYISPEEQAQAKQLLKSLGIDYENQVIIGINPGAAYGSAKCWLPERFRAVTQRLLQNPKYVVIYFGDAARSHLVHEITKYIQDSPERVFNLAGKTNLRELMALIQLCTVFLTNDSGPMHIAAALKTPVVALFGSTNDVITGPSYGISKVINKRVECAPCHKRVCPKDFRCMKRIHVDEVYEEIEKFIKSKPHKVE